MSLEDFLSEWHSNSPYVLVHTSGSTGTPKPLLVEKRRMEASARITCRFLGLKAGDTALLCLPLDYIAGKMMVVRALTCGLRLLSVEPSGHPLNTLHSTLNFAAMVPLQVWNSLQVPEERERLKDIRHLIIGGGSIDDELAQQLKDFPNAVWSTYGMTETLSHIALRRLSGPEASEWYTPFDGVNVSLNDDGCLVINAPAVHDGPLVTNDIAELRPSLEEGLAVGSFRILGRKDNVICSGGIKIQAEEVERLLRPHLKAPFCITRKKDVRLGEAVVLLTEEADAERLRPLCEQVLPRLWKPRHYVSVAKIPLTATGKIARHEAEKHAIVYEKK
jgi:O-succinylbenzoic acid--CoA ligase